MIFRVSIFWFAAAVLIFNSPVAWGWQAGVAGPVRVHLAAGERQVDQQSVLVGDVAEISDGDPRIRAQIKSLDLGELNPNEPKSVSAENIRYRILVAGISDDQFVLSGEAFTNLHYQDSKSRIAALTDQLHAYLAEHYQIPTDQLILEMNAASEKLIYQKLANQELRFEVSATLPTSLPLGRVYLDTQVHWSDGHSVKFRAPVDIKVLQPVVLTNRPISKGDLIRAEDVHTSIMPLDRPGVHLASAEELVGKAAIRDLAPYSVVDAKAVQNPSSAKTEIVVKANSAIDLIYSNNGVEIRMSGLRALNSGAVGDSIMVLNTRTNKRVRGQIIDGQTAKVIVAGAVD